MTRADKCDALCAAIGKMIRAARHEAGLTQEQLGVAAGYSAESAKPQVCRAEHGREHFRIDALYRYADALQVDLRKLLP